MNTAAVQDAIDNFYATLERQRYQFYFGSYTESPPALYEALWQFAYEAKNMFLFLTSMAYNNTYTTVWKEPEPVPFLRKFYDDMFEVYGVDREMSPAEMFKLFGFLYIERGRTDWEEELPEFALQVEAALGGRRNIAALFDLLRQHRLNQETFDRVVYPDTRVPVRLVSGDVVLLAPNGLPKSLEGRELRYDQPNELKPTEEVEIEENIAVEIYEHKYSDDESKSEDEPEEVLMMVVPQRDRSVRLVYQDKGTSQYAPTMFAGTMGSPAHVSGLSDMQQSLSRYNHPPA